MVVRYRIEGGLTDALGDLVGKADGGCTVRTRRADVVIPLRLVVAAKEVAARPAAPSPGTCPPLGRPAGHAPPAPSNGHNAHMPILASCVGHARPGRAWPRSMPIVGGRHAGLSSATPRDMPSPSPEQWT